MRAMSAYSVRIDVAFHHHSGAECFGQQCLETAGRTHVMNKGNALVIPAGIAMRLVATGPTPRRGLALIVYDASQPPTTRMKGEAAQTDVVPVAWISSFRVGLGHQRRVSRFPDGLGWEAGIRTPITCSRGRCPTVGRPPSASRGA